MNTNAKQIQPASAAAEDIGTSRNRKWRCHFNIESPQTIQCIV